VTLYEGKLHVSVVDIGENNDAKLGMWMICSAKVGDVASILEEHAVSSTWVTWPLCEAC